jgi:hypothetical protein
LNNSNKLKIIHCSYSIRGVLIEAQMHRQL